MERTEVVLIILVDCDVRAADVDPMWFGIITAD